MKDQSNYGGETTYNLQDASVSDLSAWLQEVGCAFIDLWQNLTWKSNSAIYPHFGYGDHWFLLIQDILPEKARIWTWISLKLAMICQTNSIYFKSLILLSLLCELPLLKPPYFAKESKILFRCISESKIWNVSGELRREEPGGLQGKDEQLETQEGRRTICDAQIAKSFCPKRFGRKGTQKWQTKKWFLAARQLGLAAC